MNTELILRHLGSALEILLDDAIGADATGNPNLAKQLTKLTDDVTDLMLSVAKLELGIPN